MSVPVRLDSIEAKRVRLMEELAGADPALLSARPGPGKWSIREIVEHLVLSERDVLGEPDELAAREPLKRSTKDRFRYLIVMFILRFDIPVKAPSPGMLPEGDRDLAGLGVDWEAGHAELRRWLESSDPAIVARPLFVHPVAGPMTTAQSLRMLEVHLDRHLRQIRSILKRARPPGPHG
jgi:hypothetical protein